MKLNTIVPTGGPTRLTALSLGATLLAAEARCHSTFGTAEIERARQLLEDMIAIITTHDGVAEPIGDRGIVGHWADLQEGSERAARAMYAIAAKYKPARASERSAYISSERVNFGMAAVLADLPGNALERAYHLASLAHPDRAFFSHEAYEQVVERFDFQGLQPVVPKSERLEPVFELIGPKPERSGTHHHGPEDLPLVGRRELLQALENCRLEVANGKSVVIHLVGEPGQGKSKLIREWLGESGQLGRLTLWVQLTCNGVPYGDYSLRSWQRLVAPLMRSDSGSCPQASGVQAVCKKLRAQGYPVLIIADDLHWIDAGSQSLIVQLISMVRPMLAILAYRPSFAPKAPMGPPVIHRRFRLTPLTDEEMAALIEVLAEKDDARLPSGTVREIVRKSQGNPLYAKEAVAHLIAVGPQRAGSLPSSLVEILSVRTEWTASELLPGLRGRYRAFVFGGGARQALLDEAERLEEQLSAWLDRFDVVEEESAQAVSRFLEALRRVDGELAILSLLCGKQRPHRNRLAQALTRVGAFVERTDEREA